MSIESLLIAAQYLDSQEEGSEDQDIGITSHSLFCNSPPSSSSSNDSSSRKSPTKGRSPNQRGGRRSETNRSINREIHNRLEKNRRAQMKEGFERLKKLVPNVRSPKISSLALLKEVTNYVNFLKSEDESLEVEKKNLEIIQMNCLNTLKLLKKSPKSYKKKKLPKNNTDNESTTTASEGDEVDVNRKKISKLSQGNKDKKFHKTTMAQSKFISTENASRPSVLVSVKDEPVDVESSEPQRESFILYSHLTSSLPPISTLNPPIKTAADVLPSYDTISKDTSTLTCSSSKAAAEILLELNNFQDLAPNNQICSDELIEDKDMKINIPIDASPEKKVITDTSYTENTGQMKVIRKRKSIAEEISSVIQEPQNKITLISAPKQILSPPITKIKKEAILVQDEKAKYVVAFRPCSIKNNSNQTTRPLDVKHVTPKVLVNSTKSGSEQIFLISNSQVNPGSGDFKSKLMVLENELKLVSCKSTIKEEPNVDNNNPTGFRSNSSGGMLENSFQPNLKLSKDGETGNVTSQNKNNPRDIILQVPSNALPSFGIVLSPMNSNGIISEVKLTSQKSSQEPIASEESSKTFHNLQPMSVAPLENDYIVKATAPNPFGLRCNDSKLYFIAVQNSNKTISMNGNNI